MPDPLDHLVRQWTRLGVGFEAAPSCDRPDLKRLLLDTARDSPRMARLFILAATSLHRYGDLVARHRPKRLIREELELKPIALRPTDWIMHRNPDLVPRADFRGDLRASVLASLGHDPGAGRSELDLARRSGGSRAQVRAALDNLEMTGKARRVRVEGRKRVTVTALQPSELSAWRPGSCGVQSDSGRIEWRTEAPGPGFPPGDL